ncbi:MAG: PUA domain-containing protein [Nitrososphaerota archaeon]|nr:RNA-binding protein [Candidatus Bathyarchaeota archaeon]MDW8023160.1 PUA domain-containing protein [Nitrososphaerota archaeon]
MSKKYKRCFLKAKEAKAVLRDASVRLKINLEGIFGVTAKVERAETDFGEIFFINGEPLLFKKTGDGFFPTLLFKEFFASSPKIVVDMGAVPHICNGANVMAPGVVRFEGNFNKGDLVFVVDEKYTKPIAIGEAIYSYAEVAEVKHGVVVKTIHFVGDRIWNSLKKLKDGNINL